MPPTSAIFWLGDVLQAQGLAGALSDRFPIRRRTIKDRRTAFFDTFDWRLHRSGARLSVETVQQGQVLRLHRRKDPVGLRCPVASPPDFVWNLSAGPLRSALESTVDMRRLMPVVELLANGDEISILDSRDKTVARAEIIAYTARHPERVRPAAKLPEMLIVTSIRGYEESFTSLVEFVSRDLHLEAAAVDPFVSALHSIGRQPGDYSSKLDLHLDPQMRSDAALKTIHKNLLRTMRLNEPGVRADLDSEFLHDYRVAVRRTRSALTQVKNVYPAETVARFKQDFAWLGEVTGPCRDLHVYQLKLPGYRAALPTAIRADLAPLGIFLTSHQRQEQARLLEALDSPRYQTLIEDWVEFLDADLPSEGAPELATQPIIQVAADRTWRAYRKVCKRGRAIDGDTPAEALHRLRIDCKKLRYLLEFFRSLFPSDQVDPLVRDLKKLQDNLGDFNDLEVQQQKLTVYAESMKRESLAPASTLLAMGRLVGSLAERQADERNRFHRRFKKFDRQRNRDRSRRLFKRVEMDES